jgi:hypothetical protein
MCRILYTNQLFAGRDNHIMTCVPELGEFVSITLVRKNETDYTDNIMMQWKQFATFVRLQHINIVCK